MKKILYFAILLWFAQVVKAQNIKVYPTPYDIYICKNPNGVVETLLKTQEKSTGKIGFIYRSSNKPNVDIPLTIVSNKNNEVFVVTFPNDNKRYTLKISDYFSIVCTNPDGSVQTFDIDSYTWGNRGTFRCINPDKTTEYLRIEGSGKNLKVKYSSSKNPQWIDLKVLDSQIGEVDNLIYVNVQFPNEKITYRIEGIEFSYDYICKSPKGVQQKFEWINK